MNQQQKKHQWLGSDLDYHAVWEQQNAHIANMIEGLADDVFWYLEHAPVYTIGRTKDTSSLHDPSFLPHPSVEINRGGQATYHGPGQLVGYPLIDLNSLKKDLHLYVRALEQALIDTCASFGLQANRREGLTGVWVENRKLASIGVGVKKWRTMHGFAINVTKESLPPFLAITPCGIDGVSMTSVSNELQLEISVRDFASASEMHLEKNIHSLAANKP